MRRVPHPQCFSSSPCEWFWHLHSAALVSDWFPPDRCCIIGSSSCWSPRPGFDWHLNGESRALEPPMKTRAESMKRTSQHRRNRQEKRQLERLQTDRWAPTPPQGQTGQDADPRRQKTHRAGRAEAQTDRCGATPDPQRKQSTLGLHPAKLTPNSKSYG